MKRLTEASYLLLFQFPSAFVSDLRRQISKVKANDTALFLTCQIRWNRKCAFTINHLGTTATHSCLGKLSAKI
jgi:hypothetical protein